MKVYVIAVESVLTGNVKVSQEGYSTFEKAKTAINLKTSFVDSEWVNDWVCAAKHYTYEIKEISVV